MPCLVRALVDPLRSRPLQHWWWRSDFCVSRRTTTVAMEKGRASPSSESLSRISRWIQRYFSAARPRLVCSQKGCWGLSTCYGAIPGPTLPAVLSAGSPCQSTACIDWLLVAKGFMRKTLADNACAHTVLLPR